MGCPLPASGQWTVLGMAFDVLMQWGTCRRASGTCFYPITSYVRLTVMFTCNSYINMDYLFYSSLRDTSLPRIVVSYDIACQWDRNFWARMSQKFPGGWAVNRGCVYLVFLVPKFHLPAHIKRCNIDYSFNYTKWVGRTDGEEVERGWARLNGLSYSTKEMGPGSRRDTIEDHMGYSNWRKVTGLGRYHELALRRIIPASTMY